MRSIVHRGWFQAALVGVLLFILIDIVIKYTGNPIYFPTFIMLGSFIVPVAFAAYFYRQEYLLDRNVHDGIPLVMASVVFLIGGVIATVIAGTLESFMAFDSAWQLFLGASGIEEASKLVFPVIVFLLAKYRTEVDGLVFGIAAGLGFAALETMGYGLGILVDLSSGMSDLEQVLIIRGLLSPLGHAAWTGLVCGAIWHYRGQGKKLVIMSIVYFLLAVVLHFLWNIAADRGELFIVYPIVVAIGAVGLFFVFRHLRHARQKSDASSSQIIWKR